MGTGNDSFGFECQLAYVFTVCIIVKKSTASTEANSSMLAYRLKRTAACNFRHRKGSRKQHVSQIWWNVHLFLDMKTTAIPNPTHHRNTSCNTVANITQDCTSARHEDVREWR
jgi:hypothetical protein